MVEEVTVQLRPVHLKTQRLALIVMLGMLQYLALNIFMILKLQIQILFMVIQQQFSLLLVNAISVLNISIL